MMVASLTPRVDFVPVPRIEVSITDLVEIDGGSAGSTGCGVVDGGGVTGPGSVIDGGSAFRADVVLPAGTDRVTLWRTCENRSMKVRGVVDRTFTGTLGVQDLEAPFEASSSYELQCFDGSTELGTVSLGSAVLPRLEGERWLTLIQQPLNPNLWAVVEEVDINVPSIERDAVGELVLPDGGGYPRLVGFGPRQGVQGAELVLAAETREVAARVWATLGTPDAQQLQAWLIRSNHPLLPRVFFCRVGSLREQTFDIHIGGEKTRFLSTVTEIESPVPGISIPVLRYTDLVAALGGTYSSIADALPSYAQWATAWEYAGAAG